MSSGLKVVGQVVDPKAVAWDKRVGDVIRDFVHLGELLIEGRDNQYYRELGFDSLEQWAKAKPGISWVRAKQVVSNCLVYKAITSNLGDGILSPKTQAHVEAIKSMASINYEERELTKGDGTPGQKVKQPVGVRNQKALADQWAKTVREFDRRTKKAEKEGKKPPTFSGKFVRNMLPNEFKVSPVRGFQCNPLVHLKNRLEKLVESMEQQGCTNSRRLEKLVTTEPPALPVQLEWLKSAADDAIQTISRMRDLLNEYEYVEVDE